MRLLKPVYLSAALALVLASCGGTKFSNYTPIGGVDHLPKRTTALTDEQLKRWSHLDLVRDTVPGMSVDRAYQELLKGKKATKVVVGVIDSGIEIEHDDLKKAVWTNPKEKAANGIDDDQNGYIDDIHGWNFLGKAVHENLEYTRIVKKGDDGTEQYKKALAKHREEINEAVQSKPRVDILINANKELLAYFKADTYTLQDLEKIDAKADSKIVQAKNIMYGILSRGNDLSVIDKYRKQVESKLEYQLNVEFNGRALTGDNPDDLNDVPYGDNNVMGPDRDEAMHGTHVAGIIAQERHNNLGGDGVASDVVEIMAVRAVPDGDEYDKDIALAIRYAVDNGAKVINGSFGKYFETHSQWVRDAIVYAAEKDVLIVVAAGNDALDLNKDGGVDRFPNDNVRMGKEISDNFLVVGALNPEFSEKLIASFSNYGHYDVDVFAPGVKIYATVPHNTYDFLQGTSMASPNVAGVAALVRAYYPKLTAGQVKKILMDSGIAIDKEVILGGKPTDKRNFKAISTSGKIVNAYNAILLADQVSRAKK
ncbi:S8 family peptidase [Flavobacterium sp. JP2137]|uniref:S8 family peptidase n=1 Tax=Flavobacterium sp. JP2137 TaxID=3414510 RepID=UPI003D2FE392